MGKSILFISPFHPDNSLSPRHRAVHNHVEYFKSKGYSISFIHLSNEKIKIKDDIEFIRLQLPGIIEVFKNIFFKALIKKDFSLQTCLFYSNNIHSFLKNKKIENNYNLVFFESIRTAPYHRIFKSKFKIIDLGDLISRRYMLLFKSKIAVGNIFGQFDFKSKLIRFFLESFIVQKMILLVESKLVQMAEKNAVTQFDSIILVSDYEKKMLQKYNPRATIHHIPNIDFNSETSIPSFKRNKVISYFGILNNPHNEHSILYFLNNIYKQLIEVNNNVHFNIYGKSPSDKIKNAASKFQNISIKGYVDDLENSIKDSNLLVVPIVAGSGVKTKVLDAMRWGVPIVSSEEGVSGLLNIEESGILVSKSDNDFVDKINSILNDEIFSNLCSEKSLIHYDKYYSKKSIYKKYDFIIIR